MRREPVNDIAADQNVRGIKLSEDSKAAARWSLENGGGYYGVAPAPVSQAFAFRGEDSLHPQCRLIWGGMAEYSPPPVAFQSS